MVPGSPVDRKCRLGLPMKPLWRVFIAEALVSELRTMFCRAARRSGSDQRAPKAGLWKAALRPKASLLWRLRIALAMGSLGFSVQGSQTSPTDTLLQALARNPTT